MSPYEPSTTALDAPPRGRVFADGFEGAGLRKDVLLLTDGRFSDGTTGLRIGHIAPEATGHGPVALVRDGDLIRVDIAARALDLLVDDAELASRRDGWEPLPRATHVAFSPIPRDS